MSITPLPVPKSKSATVVFARGDVYSSLFLVTFFTGFSILNDLISLSTVSFTSPQSDIIPFIVPSSRRILVRALVSMPLMPTISFFSR